MEYNELRIVISILFLITCHFSGRASLKLHWATYLCGLHWTICQTSCIWLTWSSLFIPVNILYFHYSYILILLIFIESLKCNINLQSYLSHDYISFMMWKHYSILQVRQIWYDTNCSYLCFDEVMYECMKCTPGLL